MLEATPGRGSMPPPLPLSPWRGGKSLRGGALHCPRKELLVGQRRTSQAGMPRRQRINKVTRTLRPKPPPLSHSPPIRTLRVALRGGSAARWRDSRRTHCGSGCNGGNSSRTRCRPLTPPLSHSPPIRMLRVALRGGSAARRCSSRSAHYGSGRNGGTNGRTCRRPSSG